MRAVSRAVSILRSFSVDRPYLSLSEIAQATKLDAGTTRRLLVTLRDEGLVQQNPGTGQYSLTLSVLELASAVPEGVALKDLVDSRLRQLATETGTTAYLSVAKGAEALCLARYHGESAVEVRWWSVGETMPLNCGAGPRVLLAHLPPEDQKAVLARPLARLTDFSETDPAHLRRDLDRIVAQGWVITQDDVAAGLSAMAMPLKNDRGETVAAVSIGGLTPQIVGRNQNGLLGQLDAAVHDMARLVRTVDGHKSSGEIKVVS
ncbi:MAG: IclR family transcriptional regulator [Rhodobacteraceae bacterium]|nr:IclR family transcriptional regulator [Paracoccaceae bacterium]